MRRVCMDCGVCYGEKEPLDDHRATHGLCQADFEKRWNELNGVQDTDHLGRPDLETNRMGGTCEKPS